jgi:hypothetical protein
MFLKHFSRLSGFLLFLCLAASSGFGQGETARLTGNVTDQNGAAVPGAAVTIKSTTTGFTRSTTTNDSGYYAIPNVAPGTYDITIKSGNFAEFKAQRDLSVAADVVLNAALGATVGAVVDVVAGTDIGEVNTTEQSISEVVTSRQIENLPTITRNPYDFVVAAGNVSEGDNGGRGVGVAINGQRSASTSILLNGGENVDNFTATVGQGVPLDSVDEFRLISGTFTAEFGRATGGVVNLVTKSGQNRFFGTAYFFNRPSVLASADFDTNANGLEREFFNRNQYGFSIGGPVVKDKLLFFNNTEWTKIRSASTTIAMVPSASCIAQAAANTQAFFAGQTLVATPTGRTASLTASDGRVCVFDEVQYSVPADSGAGTPLSGVQSVSRIDWNVNDKVQIYGVYSLDRNDSEIGANADSPYAGYNTGFLNRNTNMQVAGTYSLSPNFVGVSRFTYNKLLVDQPLGEQPPGPTLYMRTSVTNVGGQPIAFPGYLPFNPGLAIPFGGPQKVFNFSQEFNWNAGGALYKFGGQYYKIHDDRTFGAFMNAVETLGNSGSSAITNFLNGRLLQFQTAVDPQGHFPGEKITLPVAFPSFTRNNRYDEFAVYGNVSFKLFPGFTTNLGLRYEYYGPQKNTDPNLESNFYFGGDGGLSPANVRTGKVLTTPNSPIGQTWKSDKNNFGPSIGFAYDIEGNGRTAFRGGYALRYERNFGNVTFNMIQNPPNYGVVTVTAADLGVPFIPITTNNAGPLAGSSGTVTLPGVSLRAVDPNIQNAYAHQYSAAVERRFKDFTGSVLFTGTVGKKLYSIANINRRGSGIAFLGNSSTLCPTQPTSDRLNCQYTDINFRGNQGHSDYQALIFAVESGNLRNTGLTITSRYAWSVSHDNLSTTFSETGNAFNLGFLDVWNPDVDYGYADFDVRHRWVTTFVYEVPTIGWAKEGIGKALLGGWGISGIVNVQSGSPYSVYDCLNGFSTCTRALIVGPVTNTGSVGSDTGDPNRFVYNTNSGLISDALPGCTTFVDLFPGENGCLPDNMSKRNQFRGPGFWNVDLAVMKRWYFTERVNLQLRVDAQNAFNHANPFVNVSEQDIAGFFGEGQTTTVSKFGRRQIQVGLKLTF